MADVTTGAIILVIALGINIKRDMDYSPMDLIATTLVNIFGECASECVHVLVRVCISFYCMYVFTWVFVYECVCKVCEFSWCLR